MRICMTIKIITERFYIQIITWTAYLQRHGVMAEYSLIYMTFEYISEVDIEPRLTACSISLVVNSSTTD